MMNVPQPMTACNHHSLEALFPAQPQASAPPALPTYPEAPCSINGYVAVEGYARDFQVTGRGATGPEAAQHLKASVDALRVVLTPRVPPCVPLAPLPTRLAALLACGLERALRHDDLDRVERLAKAAALVLGDAVHAAAIEGRYTVLSRTQTGIAVDVDASGSCGCPDYRHKTTPEKPWLCKHILSVLFTIRLREQEAAHAA